MKRVPMLASFLLLLGLCASATYWVMQWLKPVARPVVAVEQSKIAVNPEAAFSLFGGRRAPIVPASNFQLRGVVVADNSLESVAILSADGKPAEATRVNAEAIPGVTLKEVHPQYVLLLEGGIIKRVELPATATQSRVEPPVTLPLQVSSSATPHAETPPGVPPPPPPNSHVGRTDQWKHKR